ncbi:SEL1-like repeat protein [Paraburkholderia sp. GAS334]|uniref:SEL1-like repeat protein n=1 Tax=Paraburkholderia sp. GAS334 TaxID=3035131 RepID=UPI003D1CDC2A
MKLLGNIVWFTGALALLTSTNIYAENSTTTSSDDFGKLSYSELLPIAEHGDPKAQNELGRRFSLGKGGVSQDQKQALIWFSKSANQNNAYGQNMVGLLYLNGVSVTKDYQKALDWFRKSADQGYAEGEANYALMFQNGYGVARDYKISQDWYRKAAEKNIARAEFNLGAIYFNGLGVPQDYKQALNWFSKAANQGHANAEYALGQMYAEGTGTARDYKAARELLTKAADQGNPSAQSYLGWMYYQGAGVAKDYKKSIDFYSKAAAQGDTDAQRNLEMVKKELYDNVDKEMAIMDASDNEQLRAPDNNRGSKNQGAASEKGVSPVKVGVSLENIANELDTVVKVSAIEDHVIINKIIINRGNSCDSATGKPLMHLGESTPRSDFPITLKYGQNYKVVQLSCHADDIMEVLVSTSTGDFKFNKNNFD